VATPTNHLALPIERDLDRGACELVKEGKIRNQHRLFDSARPFPDGVMLQTSSSGRILTIITQYLCLRAGEKPPEGRTGSTTIDAPAPQTPSAAPAAPSRAKDADCRTIRGTDGSETVICGNR
jgi:hypothetical protein